MNSRRRGRRSFWLHIAVLLLLCVPLLPLWFELDRTAFWMLPLQFCN